MTGKVSVKGLLTELLCLALAVFLVARYVGTVRGLVVLLLVLALHWAFWPHHKLPRYRTRDLSLRLMLRLYPGRGHATLWALWLRWSRTAAYRKSGRSRHSLTHWERVRHAAACSIYLGSAHFGVGLRLPLEEHVLLLAPPRTGKTGWLASVILHYPGPVVSTTTKADVFALTSGVRQRHYGPVCVFNPQGIGKVPSTFRWSPVEGCIDEATAIRRADAFASAVSMSGTDDASFWSSKTSSYLRAFFHAADLVDGDMHLVVRWALGDASQAEHILSKAGKTQWALEVAELRGEAAKTTATIRMCLSRALAFMTDPALQLSVLPVGGDGLDFEEFLRSRSTLYLVADSDSDDSPLAPLFACLANELHYTAEILGQAMPGSRLDPPLLMALDEIVQTCPVPVDKWLSDSGGKGIQIITVAHGEAQLATRWKEAGKQVILDTSSVKIFLPGITDTSTLEMASKLCGQTALKERGHDSHSRHDVMAPDMIRTLPAWRGLVLRSGYAPVIAKLPRAWKDRAYKRAARKGQALALLTPAAAPASGARPVPALALVRDKEAVADYAPEGDELASGATPWRDEK